MTSRPSTSSASPGTFADRLLQLCEEVIGPNASAVDAGARNPVESWDAFHQIGALGLRVPVEHGGLWVEDVTYVDTISTIARYCAASAMTLHMHSVASELIATLGSPEQQRKFFPLAVDQGGLFGSWGSEPGFSASLKMSLETVVVPKDDVLVVNGLKYFCTMAGAASGAMVVVALGGQPEGEAPQEFVHVFVRKDQPGSTIVGEWNPLGMRGTVSPGVRFEDCELERDALFYGGFSAGVIERLSLGFAAVMLGIAEGALDATTSYLAKKRYVTQDGTLAYEPTVQRHVGDVAAQLSAARCSLHSSAQDWPSGSRHVLATRAKYVVTIAALRTLDQCVQVVGGNAATKALPLERNYRDLRTCSLMPPNMDRMQQILGEDFLGVESRMYVK